MHRRMTKARHLAEARRRAAGAAPAHPQATSEFVAIGVWKNPLRPDDAKHYEAEPGGTLIAWLQKHYPQGFGRPIAIEWNGAPWEIEAADRFMAAGDVISLHVQPGGPGVIPFIAKAAISAVASLIASTLVGLIFGKPKKPADARKPDPVYDLGGSGNSARLNEPIPAIYGRVITVPDWASQPYIRYIGNEQYLEQILVIGQGQFDVESVLVGDTPVSALAAGQVAYAVWPQSEHQNTMGRIEDILGVMENVITSPEVANQEFMNPKDGSGISTHGPFVVGKPGVRGDKIMIDIVFPQGLFATLNDSTVYETSRRLTLTMTPVDDAGNAIGADIVNTWDIISKSENPLRFTYDFAVPLGRYKVKLHSPQQGTGTSPRFAMDFLWTALKFRLQRTATPVYGDTTLLIIRIKATNGIASQAAARVRVVCTRRLPYLGVGAVVPTRSPAQAFFDIMMNTTYGARRPGSEVDISGVANLEQHWAGRARFDAIFSSKSTVWEALVLALQPAAASPLPDGQLMSAISDGQKAIRTQFYSDANMVRGSLQLGYQFDKPGENTGFSVEYRDPATFAPAYAVWPAGALDLEQATLFGCTDATTALQYARLLWQRQRYQRRLADFETELEGMLPRFGDRIAVSSQMPLWGQSGVLVGATGLAVLTDEPLDWTGGAKVMMLRNERGQPSNLISVTRGGSDFEAVLANDPGFPLSVNMRAEPTHYAFGETSLTVRDFVVSNIAHEGGVRTRISGMIYDPQIWAGTLPWLTEPI